MPTGIPLWKRGLLIVSNNAPASPILGNVFAWLWQNPVRHSRISRLRTKKERRRFPMCLKQIVLTGSEHQLMYPDVFCHNDSCKTGGFRR
jgi:hypothetical protein